MTTPLNPQADSKKLKPFEKWAVGISGGALTAAALLAYRYPPTLGSVSSGADGAIKTSAKHADPSSIVVSCLGIGVLLLVFAINGRRLTKFAFGGVEAEGPDDNEPQSSAGGSREPSAPPPAAAAAGMVPAAMISELLENFFKLSSWNGKKILYAAALASRTGKALELKRLCEADKRMSFDYAFGYLVSASSAGFFTVQQATDASIVIIGGFQDQNFEYLMKHIQGHLPIPLADTENKKTEIRFISAFIGVPPPEFVR